MFVKLGKLIFNYISYSVHLKINTRIFMIVLRTYNCVSTIYTTYLEKAADSALFDILHWGVAPIENLLPTVEEGVGLETSMKPEGHGRARWPPKDRSQMVRIAGTQLENWQNTWSSC